MHFSCTVLTKIGAKMCVDLLNAQLLELLNVYLLEESFPRSRTGLSLLLWEISGSVNASL